MVDRIFGDMYNQNKQFRYFSEFEVSVTEVQDIEDIKEELYAFHIRIMDIPEFGVDSNVLIRVDFEDLEQVNDLADLLFELDYLSEEQYTNFENNLEEYNNADQ